MTFLETRVKLLEDRVAELEKQLAEYGVLAANAPEDCRNHTCTYFIHYLAYGPAELTHEGFHAAEKNCERLQKRAEDWLEQNKGNNKQFPEYLDKICRVAEARIRA